MRLILALSILLFSMFSFASMESQGISTIELEQTAVLSFDLGSEKLYIANMDLTAANQSYDYPELPTQKEINKSQRMLPHLSKMMEHKVLGDNQRFLFRFSRC